MSDLSQAIEAINVEAAGFFNLHIIRPDDRIKLVEGTLAGTTNAAWLLQTVTTAMACINAFPKYRTALCGCCPRPLRRHQYSIVIVQPHSGNPTSVLTFAVCSKCGPTDATMHSKAVEALRNLMPGMQQITMEGHA